MAGVFETAYTTMGISFDEFELLASALFVLLLFLSVILLFVARKRIQKIRQLNRTLISIKEDNRRALQMMRTSETEKSKILGEHEEALAKLKEAKEVLIKMDEEMQGYKSGSQEDVGKVVAMEEELKFYRLKLGELKEEKEELLKQSHTERGKKEEEIRRAKLKLEKELEASKVRADLIKEEQDTEIKKKTAEYEKRIEEIKTQTTDAMQKLTKEKEKEIDALKKENDRLEKDVEELKDKIRVLEIEKL